MPKQPDDQSTDRDPDMVVQDEDMTLDENGDMAAQQLGGEAVFAEGGTDPDVEHADIELAESDSAALQTELTSARERVLRLQAELENYRKRAQRSLEEERRYSSLPLLRDLLTVVDNLQRAIDAARQNEGSAGLLEGVEMVAEQLGGILQQHHCEEIPAAGAKFDPNLHEAIAQFPAEEFEPGDVTQVTQVGYQLHGRVIRPSQVIVAAPKPGANGE